VILFLLLYRPGPRLYAGGRWDEEEVTQR